MTDQFEVELAMGGKIVFQHESGSNLIGVTHTLPTESEWHGHGNKLDAITLNHNEKLRLIKWLINTVR